MTPRARRIAALVVTVVVLLFAGRWVAGLFAERWWAEQISPAAASGVMRWALVGFGLEATGILVACFWFIGHLQNFQVSQTLRGLFAYLSFALHYADFVQGLLRSEGVLFYVLVSAVALTLNAGYLQWRR